MPHLSQAVDYYLTSGFAQTGEHYWQRDEVPLEAAPFCPIALRVRNPQGKSRGYCLVEGTGDH